MTSSGSDGEESEPGGFKLEKKHVHEIATDTNKADAARDKRAPTNQKAISQPAHGLGGKTLARHIRGDLNGSESDGDSQPGDAVLEKESEASDAQPNDHVEDSNNESAVLDAHPVDLAADHGNEHIDEAHVHHDSPQDSNSNCPTRNI